jgi:epsin
VDLLADTQRVKDERKKARINRNKYTGVASDGRSTSDTSQYTGFGRDTPMRSSTSAGFQDDPDEALSTKSDSENHQKSVATANPTSGSSPGITTAQITSSNSSNTSKAAPAPPKVANLLDFDAPQHATFPSATATLTQQTTSLNAVEDWSDFTTTATTASGTSVAANSPALSDPKRIILIDDFADFQGASAPSNVEQQLKAFPDFHGNSTLNFNGSHIINNTVATQSSFTAFPQLQSTGPFANSASYLPPAQSASQQQKEILPSSRDLLGSLVSLDATSLGTANGGKNVNDLGPSLNALKTRQTQVMQQSIGVAGIPMAGTGLKQQGNAYTQSFATDTLI